MIGEVSTTSQPYVGLVDFSFGFARGSSFKNLYRGYKFDPKTLPKAKTNEQALLQTIMIYQFVINDLAQYIATHIEEDDVLDLKNELTKELDKCMMIFEKTYHPLTIYQMDKNALYIKEDFPWETGEY